MSFNMMVNDDYYGDKNQGQQSNDQYPFGGPNGFDFVTDNKRAPGGGNQPYYAPSNQTAAPATSFYSDWSQPDQFYNPQQFVPDKGDPFSQPQYKAGSAQDFENEPPLLEELGINFDHIFKKTKSVLNPFAKPHESIIHDEDLAGPLVFCIAYGFSLLLMGKVQFGFIYGVTALGCVSMYALLNLMLEKGISAICVGSTLGYCLLPMVILSFISLVLPLNGLLGLFVSLIFIFWCSISASNLFVSAHNMANQQILVLYPCFLLYGIFALLNAF